MGEVIDQSSRWRMLLDALSIHKRLSVTEAAELLGVPAATVRRDFEELARQQLATPHPRGRGRHHRRLRPARAISHRPRRPA